MFDILFFFHIVPLICSDEQGMKCVALSEVERLFLWPIVEGKQTEVKQPKQRQKKNTQANRQMHDVIRQRQVLAAALHPSPWVLQSLAVPLRKASVLSCDLSLPRIIHDYIADMLAHANNFSSEPMSATSYLMYLCGVCMWARHNLYLSVYVHAPEIRFCVQFDFETNSMVNTIWQRRRDTYITARWVIRVKWTNRLFAWEEVSLCRELLRWVSLGIIPSWNQIGGSTPTGLDFDVNGQWFLFLRKKFEVDPTELKLQSFPCALHSFKVPLFLHSRGQNCPLKNVFNFLPQSPEWHPRTAHSCNSRPYTITNGTC